MEKAPPKIDVKANRMARKYSTGELVARTLWGVVYPLFRFSPRTFFRWRCFLLRLFGAQVGRDVHIYNSAKIVMPWNLAVDDLSCIGESCLIYNLGPVTIGYQTTISHRVHLCAGTHDYTLPDLPLLKSEIYIGDQVWLCADSLIGPGVTVGEGAVVGAAAVVMKDVEPWWVVAGNPAVKVKRRILREGAEYV